MIDVAKVFDARESEIAELRSAVEKFRRELQRRGRPGSSPNSPLFDLVPALVGGVERYSLLAPEFGSDLIRFAPFLRAGELDDEQTEVLSSGSKTTLDLLDAHLSGLKAARARADHIAESTKRLRMLNLDNSAIGPLFVDHGGHQFRPIVVFDESSPPDCEPPAECLVAGQVLRGVTLPDAHQAMYIAATLQDRTATRNFLGTWASFAAALLDSVDDAPSRRECARWALAGALLSTVIRREEPGLARRFDLARLNHYASQDAHVPPEVQEMLAAAALPFAPDDENSLPERAHSLLKDLDSLAERMEEKAAKRGRPFDMSSRTHRLALLVLASPEALTVKEWEVSAKEQTPPLKFARIRNQLREIADCGRYDVMREELDGTLHYGTPRAIDRKRAQLESRSP